MTKERLRNALLVILSAGVFIGFLSPFGMDETPIQWSIFYWVVTCLAGYFIYMPIIFFGDRLLEKVLPVHWCRIALAVFTASILMTLVIPIISWLIFSKEINLAVQFFIIFPKVIVIGCVLTFAHFLQEYFKWQKAEISAQRQLNDAHQQQAIEQTTKHENQDIEAFMALLPIDKRGKLICLEMADHYVKVYTNKGHHLLLMRFKDALEKLALYSGIQTHRSWWVAIDAITAMNREGRKSTLLLTNSLTVPISRTYADNVKAANIH